MKIIRTLEFHTGTKEEKLPGFTPDFPYIASQAELDYYREHFVPWHWHRAIELFYMESGELRYETPGSSGIFPAGSGGMINSNVLHTTKFRPGKGKNVQLLHIFDPLLLSGSTGSLIDQKYISPLVMASHIEIIPLYPENPEPAEILHMIRQAFRLPEDGWGYEMQVRELLSQIWLKLLGISSSRLQERFAAAHPSADKAKSMLIYIHEHYAEKISIARLSSAAYLSERECYRIFQDCLHMTPVQYITEFRIQMACRMLTESRCSITEISQACGLGSSSYFGRIFRERTGYSPLEYRRKWQDYAKN